MIKTKASAQLSRFASIAKVVLMVFAVVLIHVPDVDARRGGGGGGFSGGGGFRGGGGGSVRHSSAKRSRGASAQPTRGGARPGRDAKPGKAVTPGRGAKPGRAVTPGRSTKSGRGAARHRGASRRGHARYSARKDARRDWRRWRRNRALFAVGVAILTRPRYSTTVVISGNSYYYWGGVYYVRSGSKYVVVAPPAGAVVYAVPTYTTVVYAGTTPYYYAGGVYYVATNEPAAKPEIPDDVVLAESEENPPMTEDDHNYKVVAPPVGVTVTYLPDEAEEKRINGKTYFLYEGTYYRPFVSEGETIYQVAEGLTTG